MSLPRSPVTFALDEPKYSRSPSRDKDALVSEAGEFTAVTGTGVDHGSLMLDRLAV